MYREPGVEQDKVKRLTRYFFLKKSFLNGPLPKVTEALLYDIKVSIIRSNSALFWLFYVVLVIGLNLLTVVRKFPVILGPF